MRALLPGTLLLACSPTYDAGTDPCREQTRVTVTEAIDGDTLEVEIQDGEAVGTVETVRLLGIDTPEVNHNDTAASECYAVLAWNEAVSKIVGEDAWMTFENACTDLHGRTLAYVWRASDDLFLNGTLVQGGFARTCPWSPANALDPELAAFEQQAQAGEAGLWGTCDDPAALGECDN